ncbi:rRNA pseudouridine synthase [Candidatus Parcubacteria bacterium]|nr:rRNA pseudouridine synthase [Patescibacteria group bacterium]MBU4309801.1 rRNA pseudouridine synthase [Patescibacteria group bacterium]MBU4578140.1 rRNA pseudouridine synthase [Patescibacteria group bacterium]MCG2696677.1 rRNA pseudouridine synthase [Candidatus Parcubacteria bacterium]
MKIVLQKFIAEAGVCSRRKAEDFIKDGLVMINDKVAKLGDRVDEHDEVLLDGVQIYRQEKLVYIILNKPKGYTCTSRQFVDEKNIFDLVNAKERLFVVGRLDKNSEGLVLLTNDGALTQKITHPKYEHEKKYLVSIVSRGLEARIIQNDFKQGVDIGDGDGIVKAKNIKAVGTDKFEIILTQGKKRQIRRMFGVLGCDVLELARIKIGSLEMGDLKVGEWRYLSEAEVKGLMVEKKKEVVKKVKK